MTNEKTVSLLLTEGVDYEFSVQYLGQTLTLISAPKGTAFEAVVACARLAHRVRSSRVCAEVRLAAPEERPASWDVNPKPGLQGEIWMLVVVFEFGYPDVPGVYVEVDDE